jgi:hypothetical protein
MRDPQTKADLIEQLAYVQRALTETVQGISDAQFYDGTPESWSPAAYIKHLILSVKPLAKAFKLPANQLETMFGKPSHVPRSYADVVRLYQSRLAEGVRAEDYNGVMPTTYRMPEGIEDERKYLVDTWNDSNNRLLDALRQWQDEDLDRYQLPHPAMERLTLREMLFFTLYHNTMHWHDIQEKCGQVSVEERA